MMLALSAVISLVLALDGRVVLRDRDSAPVPGVSGADAAGVRAGEGPSARLIPWQQVARVEGEFADEAAAWVAQGDLVWRALQRLERGDLPSAEELLESLHGPIIETRGPTAAAIWKSLVRCRIERGAQTAAAGAWLAWLGVGGPAFESTAGPDEPSAMEGREEAGLIPGLPPIWVDVPSVAVVAGARQAPWVLDADRAIDPVEQLRAWYIHAARGACGTLSSVAGGDAVEWPPVSDERSVQIVSSVVLAQYGNQAERLAARERLKAMMDDRQGTWLEAWCRVAIGRSLTREADPEIRRLGVVELLHLPARLESAVPYLTGVALADAAATLRELGDMAGATRLRGELLRRFGGHPAVEWNMIREWPAATPATKTSQPELPESEEPLNDR
ncbi:MAG: hypothetical protein AMXMBFR58_23150 [Phycisphaerae bacterium]